LLPPHRRWLRTITTIITLFITTITTIIPLRVAATAEPATQADEEARCEACPFVTRLFMTLV
jgi:hypothetical protein